MRLTDLLNLRQIPFRRSTTDENEVNICCPLCAERGESADTRFRLGVNLTTSKAHCFNCGWSSGGGALRFLARFLNSPESLEQETEEGIVSRPLLALPEDFQFLVECNDDLDREAIRYLTRERKIPTRQIQRKHVGVSYSGRYAFRVIFPVYAYGKLSGIVSRDYVGQEPRYLNSPGMKTLYNLPRRSTETVILSEGVFKALRIEQAVGAEAGSAALLGHDLTEEQTDQLRDSKCRKIIIFPDLDKVGRRGAAKVADKICENIGVRPLIVPGSPAPADDLPLADLLRCIRGAVRYDWGVRQRLLALP